MIINGKQIAGKILQDLQSQLKQLSFQPVLCDVLVGDDPVSLSYVNIKKKTAESIGLGFRLIQLPATTTTHEVVSVIKDAQADKNLCGLIVQLPLPEHLDTPQILSVIDARVDVDVISNQASSLIPPTAGAIMEILDSLNLDLSAKQILVIGQGELVGKPVTVLLRERGYKVSTADQSTNNLSELTKVADVIISGTGQGGLVTGDMIKSGALVIDAGTSESGAGIVGDVDFTSVKDIASAVSPVPGGVGPVTVAKLLENVVIVASQ